MMIYKNWLYFVLWVVLFSFCIWSQPQPNVWKNQPEKIQLEVDDKGTPLSFIYHQDTSSKITVVQIFIKGGKRGVPVSKRGTAFITTRLSVEMPSAEKVRELMHLASTFFYHIDGDYSTITIESLSENIDETLGIITKILRKPLFSGLRIGNIKRYMEHRQKREEDSPEQLMERNFFNAFFPGYSGSILRRRDANV
jgi:predicted Zn-dependent peptidase